MILNITYMSGAGNLFSVIDNRDAEIDLSLGSILAPKLCTKNKYNNNETEGLMLLEESETNDFRCVFLNPDGSSGMMCGNGGRAITRFAQTKGMIKSQNPINFEMAGDIYSASFNGENIKLQMPSPNTNPIKKLIQSSLGEIQVFYSNTGTHHIVLEPEKLNLNFNDFDIEKLGSELRNHQEFKPDGTNVNFFKLKNGFSNLRTFEKGVEKETGACGTGAVATALTLKEKGILDFPIKLIPTSGEELIINLVGEYPNQVENMILEGPAKVLSERQLKIPDQELNNEQNN